MDLTVNARLQNGVMLQGGFNTGRTITDNCEVAAVAGNTTSGFGLALTDNPTRLWCHNVGNFLHQFKALGTYVVPRIDLNLAATLQSGPGPNILANYIAPNRIVEPSLGRPLSGNAQNVTVAIVEPNTLFGDRVNQLDFRLGRTFRFGSAPRAGQLRHLQRVELQRGAAAEQHVPGPRTGPPERLADAAAHHGWAALQVQRPVRLLDPTLGEAPWEGICGCRRCLYRGRHESRVARSRRGTRATVLVAGLRRNPAPPAFLKRTGRRRPRRRPAQHSRPARPLRQR